MVERAASLSAVSEHSVHYYRMDDLARRLVIARGDGIAHQKLLNELSNIDLLILDDYLTFGIDSDAPSDRFAILANREHRLPTMIASQTGLAYWVAELPVRVAADSIVNHLANTARIINLGQIDMRRHRKDQARAHETYWEYHRSGSGTQPGPLPSGATRQPDCVGSESPLGQVRQRTVIRVGVNLLDDRVLPMGFPSRDGVQGDGREERVEPVSLKTVVRRPLMDSVPGSAALPGVPRCVR